MARKRGELPLRERVGSNIRSTAAATGIPLGRLADSSGVGSSHLFAFLRGADDATLGWLEKIADTLGVEPSELLKLRPRMAPKRAKLTLRQQVAANIRRSAEETGIPLTRLAAASEASPAHLFSFLRGAHDVTLGWLEKIANTLGVEPSELLKR